MTLTTIRKVGLSLAFTCSLVAVYCIIASISGSAQTPTASTNSAQKPANNKPPAASAPALPTPPASITPSAGKHPGQDGIESDESERVELTGITTFRNWVYTRSDTVISGRTAKYNAKTDTLDTDDPVVMDDSKHHLTADRARVEHAQNDPSLRLVVLTGHAVMVLKAETAPSPGEVPPAPVQAPGSPAPGKLKVVSLSSQPPGTQPQGSSKGSPPDARNPGANLPAADKDRENAKEQQRHGGTVTCDKIEYKTSKKFAKLTGHVIFKQSFLDKDGKRIERTMTCEHAENDGKANMLHLFKPVHYESSDGQVFDSPDDVLLGTKEGEETMKTGRSTFTFTSPDEDEDSDDSKSTNAKDTKAQDTKHSTDKSATKTPP